MPGIVGIISRRRAAECNRLVQAMTETMRHEKFHVAGSFSAPDLGVFAGWVVHENSFAVQNVFQNAAKDVALVFSGEDFSGENLVNNYEQSGEKFFESLNGLFSGLLIDRRANKVVLFNDRYGVGRIYWHETTEAFYFASEAKALLRVLPGLREFDRDGVAQFLGVGTPLNGRTLFREIRLLPAASCWTFGDGKVQRTSYFAPSTWESQPGLSADEYEQAFSATFQKVLPRYFAADKKIGIALTGGLDTRMFMAAQPHDAARETSYTFTGPEGRTLDDRIAAQVAGECGLEHRLLRLGEDFFPGFATHADKTVFVTDGMSGILGAHEIYFHKLARPLAEIRLTGNFGGEILRGVSTFKPLGLAPQIFTPDIFPAMKAAGAALKKMRQNATTFAAFQEIPLNLYGNLAAGCSQLTFRTPFLDNELVALAYRRPAALEKSSLPAIRMIKACNPALDRIPTDRGYISDRRGPDILLRRAFAEVTFKLDYCSNAGLPRKFAVLDPVFKPIVRVLGVAGLHKFLKYSTWLRGPLAPFVKERLAAVKECSNPFWNPTGLAEAFNAHLAGGKNFPSEINAALTLEAVERLLFRDLPRRLDN
jgi:asparagine synthase (glutamine-hydrolysing)